MREPWHIAIVDDDESVRLALHRLLRSMGLRVAVFASGRSFLDSLVHVAPDCVLLDVHMPGLDGLAVLRQLGTMSRKVPAVAISGKDEVGLRERIRSLGALEYLTKPIDAEVLMASLRRVIGEPGAGS